MINLPQYSDEKRKGNIGEAVVAFELSKFCLVHKIDGSNDIGNDFICELIKDQHPTNLLFYVQVKHLPTEPPIEDRTVEYWRGSPIPVYLFWVKPYSGGGSEPDKEYEIKYKRYTPILHGATDANEVQYKEYSDEFKKDLVEDYARTVYIKGSTPVIEPRAFMKIDEKRELDIPQYVIPTKQLTEYKETLIRNGWTHLYTLAYVLSEKGDKQSLETAKSLTEEAQQMINMDERAESKEYNNFKAEIEELSKSIKTKLQEIN